MHVEEVDLTTGISSEVFDLDFVISGFGTAYAIVGDFFLCSMLLSLVYDASIILVNWRASTFVSLSRNGRNSAFELIPGYVVTTYRERLPSHEEQILAVTALDAFSNYWQPLTEASLTAQLARPAPTTPITVTKIVAYNNQPLGRYVELTLTPNALYRGAYNVDVQAGVSESSTLMGKIGHLITAGRWATPTVWRQALLSYRLTPAPSPGRACELRLISARCVPNHTQTFVPRASIEWTGGSIIVSYGQQ
ncbi:hypothetical protein B0H12DRAFT_315722 [Mycena haematopus]|nr:hypothetical protein B0H12DRAFT_315722 [Mycena haematopus]